MGVEDNLYRNFDLSRLVALESALDALPGIRPEVGIASELVTVSVSAPEVGAVEIDRDEVEALDAVGDDSRYRYFDLSRLIALESLLGAQSATDTGPSVVIRGHTAEAQSVSDEPNSGDLVSAEVPTVAGPTDVTGDEGESDDVAVLSDWVARLSMSQRASEPAEMPTASVDDRPRVDPLVSNPNWQRREPQLLASAATGRAAGRSADTVDDGRTEDRAAASSWRSDALIARPDPVETSPPSPRRRLGYQPGLDGLRAISVIAVVLYHAGFGWIHGGFLGVEVFFVVSGYLITTLLIEERESNGWVNLSKFWIRRGRRLLPALFAMLLAVSVWVLAFGTRAQQADLRRNLPWSIFYVANWGQIVGEVPYFQAGDPPLLRHLWSLAVEEQWYVVWPLVFIALSRLDPPRRVVTWLLAGVGTAMAIMWLVQSGALFDDPVNFNYLSTVTRSGGLLLGAVGAFVWRPWRRPVARQVDGSRFDVIFGLATAGLLVAFATANLTDAWMYPWGLTLVSVLSLACVMMIVHPAARGRIRLVDSPALVAIGKRSYGLYLWHWPVFVLVGATGGSWLRFLTGLVIAVPLTELSYRFVEVPIRSQQLTSGWLRTRPARVAAALSVAAVFVVTASAFRGVGPYDAAVGDQNVAFVLAAATTDGATQVLPPSATIAPTIATTAAPVELPKVLIVGDSQGHSLIANQPDGVESVLTFVDGTIDGCSVYETGKLTSSRGFELKTGGCSGWAQRWAGSAQEHQPDVALVVLGAWDSLDIVTSDRWYAFASPERDALFVDGLNAGLDAISPSVGSVALLEVPCMRPIAVDGAYTPPLPERADDNRTAHVNELLRRVASSRDDTTFIEGPDEWCSDPTIADNPAYRWDGVHVYQLGAKLVFEATVPTLLDLAVAEAPSTVPTG